MHTLRSPTYCLAPRVELLLDGQRITVVQEGQRLTLPRLALAVLDVFASPQTLEAAAALLSPRLGTKARWVQAMTAMHQLVTAGLLYETGGETAAFGRSGFDAAGIHCRMLLDKGRTGPYLAALAKQVKPGSVVLDCGTGVGIMALGAARAGARRVFALEQGRIALVARQMFAANDSDKVIELVQGQSTQASLAEPADLMVSELASKDPLRGEGLLEYTIDARRLLRPGATLIPRAVRIYGLAVAVPEQVRQYHAFTPASVAALSRRHGFDFTPLLAVGSDRETALAAGPELAWETWPELAPAVLVAEVDLGTVTGPSVVGRAEVTVAREGLLGGALLYFELDLGAGEVVSTRPGLDSRADSWANPVTLFPEPVLVRPGQRLEFTYAYATPGRSDGLTVAVCGRDQAAPETGPGR